MVKTVYSTTVSDQSKDTCNTISSAVNPEPVVSEDQVNKLLATISEQKITDTESDAEAGFCAILPWNK